jgi:hypothetical protein
MATISVPVDRRDITTERIERGLDLYRQHGDEIERLAEDIYLVPSQDGTTTHRVQYGEHEFCSCPDHQFRGLNCCHIYAVGIALAKRRAKKVICDGCGSRFRHPELYEVQESLTYFAGDLLCSECWHGSDAVVL